MATGFELARLAAEDRWPRARAPLAAARFRVEPEDFQVTERLSFTPTEEGEFALLEIRKTGRNTAEVARELARLAGVAPRAVSWAGRKDRRAVAVQWFSVHLPGAPGPDWSAAAGRGWEVLAAHRHARKLRTGALAANAFVLRLREFDVPPDGLTARLQALASAGVPNYFGPQRFGRGGANLLPRPRRRRDERALALSAARAAIFNLVLAERVREGSWERLRPGEVPMLRRSRAVFGPEPLGDALPARAARGEIDPTGPLWGRGLPRTAAALHALERRVAGKQGELAAMLEGAGLAQERRRLRLVPRAFAWELPAPRVVVLRFELEAGAFATSVVRELCEAR